MQITYAIGLATALFFPTAAILALLPTDIARGSVALLIGGIAIVYVGFAFVDNRPKIIVIESLHAVAFIALAIAGFAWSWWIFVATLAAHSAWDLLHRPALISTTVRPWYVPFCAVYDWLLATVSLALICSGGTTPLLLQTPQPSVHAPASPHLWRFS